MACAPYRRASWSIAMAPSARWRSVRAIGTTRPRTLSSTDWPSPPRADMSEPLGIVVAFTAGLFSFLSPCVLPLFPSYLSFVTGMSVADLQADLTAAARRRVMLHSVAFVVGFSLVFVSLGASFSAAGQLLLD